MTRLRRLLFAAALGAAAPALAADPVSPDAENPQLNRTAYSALQADAELADLNIGVRVLRDGTAVLWGTATQAEAAKAAALLKTLKGITQVKNTCDLVGAVDPLVARVEASVRAAPPTEPAGPKPPALELKPADRPAPAAPLAAAGAAVSRQTTTAEKRQVTRSLSLEPAARLLDPAPAAPAVDYAAVERVRQADRRFARLTLDLRDGRVFIGGSSTDPGSAWDLARKIAPLVGEREVVVGRIAKAK